MSTAPLSYQLFKPILRIIFNLLYHQLAWAYDVIAAIVSLGMWKDWVLAVVPDIHGPRILEIGYGPGHLQLELKKNGLFIVGSDQSPQMGRLAYQKIKNHGYLPSIVRSQAQHLPYKSHTFNQVVSTFPSEYIVDSMTLSEASRVLVPGGTLVILPIAWIRGRRWIDCLSAWLLRITGQSPEWDDRFLIPFRQAGFEVDLEKRVMGTTELIVILAEIPEDI